MKFLLSLLCTTFCNHAWIFIMTLLLLGKINKDLDVEKNGWFTKEGTHITEQHREKKQ